MFSDSLCIELGLIARIKKNFWNIQIRSSGLTIFRRKFTSLLNVSSNSSNSSTVFFGCGKIASISQISVELGNVFKRMFNIWLWFCTTSSNFICKARWDDFIDSNSWFKFLISEKWKTKLTKLMWKITNSQAELKQNLYKPKKKLQNFDSSWWHRRLHKKKNFQKQILV